MRPARCTHASTSETSPTDDRPTSVRGSGSFLAYLGGVTAYTSEPPTQVRLRDLERLEACPASAGSPSRLPTPHLDRWKALHDAVVDWHVHGEPDDPADTAERMFAEIDPVQREILEDLFAAYRRLHPKGSAVELEPEHGVFVDDRRNLSMSVGVQVEVGTDDGWEAVRIKTGRSGTTVEEAAAYYASGADKLLVDARLAEDDRVTLGAIDPEDARQIVMSVFDRFEEVSRRDATRNPGLHCYSCPRPARCGQYPAIGGDVGFRTRTIRVSKTQLAAFARCARSAAWPAVYGIPADERADGEVDQGAGLRVANLFHETVAATLLDDDTGTGFDAACRNAPASEAADLRYLFDQHLDLWDRDPYPVQVRTTEYQMGVTPVVDGLVADRRGNLGRGPVAVAMMCATDANGWESDAIAAVVEHRTGAASAPLPNEADLYAVSAWTALAKMGRDVGGVAVHFHHLRRSPAECERIFFDADAVDEAMERLTALAERIARWHPSDARSPEFGVGTHCQWCDWRRRCERHRVGPSAGDQSQDGP